MSEQTPSVGRIVHYVAYGTPKGEYEAGAHRAAIITEVQPGNDIVIGLCILNPTGLFFLRNVPYHNPDDNLAGTWHWPEYVS